MAKVDGMPYPCSLVKFIRTVDEGADSKLPGTKLWLRWWRMRDNPRTGDVDWAKGPWVVWIEDGCAAQSLTQSPREIICYTSLSLTKKSKTYDVRYI